MKFGQQIAALLAVTWRGVEVPTQRETFHVAQPKGNLPVFQPKKRNLPLSQPKKEHLLLSESKGKPLALPT